MIFQDPFACLHPMYRVGDQIAEAVAAHANVAKKAGLGARRRAARRGRHPERAVARARLPAPVLGRHAPARDDRDGARPQPRRADRRRADDRARRDRAGADPRADRRGQARVRHRRDPDHARPRRRRRDRDTRDGHVRRPGRWSTARRARSSTQPQHPYTWGLLDSMPSVEQAARSARPDRGLAAVAARTRRRAARSTRAAATASSRADRAAAARAAIPDGASRRLPPVVGATSSARAASARSPGSVTRA